MKKVIGKTFILVKNNKEYDLPKIFKVEGRDDIGWYYNAAKEVTTMPYWFIRKYYKEK